ncbi:MAG: hypothetical protein IH600_02540 [Bacteroidetes bacterium]|nr:hypothetical protein [Bacteroidota bacterium]
MNTYERHRQYLLHRQRRRRLFRRALIATAGVAAFLAVWTILSHLGPTRYAPPDPAEVGALAAREVARTAAISINTVHAELRPEFRERAKKAVLRLFDSSVTPVTPAQGSSKDSAVALPDPSAASSVNSIPIAAKATTILTPLPEYEDDVLQDLPLPSMRTMDILLIGLDSRLGHERGRADALHLLTVDFDAPLVRITSIPRGTYSKLGYRNEASNIISNVRAARGRTELQRRVAKMCRRDSVPYFVEIGFSDAFGILELLGFENPGAELQALRQRKGYQFGDHDRCYNQGLFIRSAILRLLPMLEGATGDLILRAGLDLVHTNLTSEQCRGIVYLLNDAGVTRAPSLITVTLRSRFRDRIERAGPPPAAKHAVHGLDYAGKGGDAARAERRIRRALADAARQRGDARRVRSLLWTLFVQHAWLQLEVGTSRSALRDSIAGSLAEACAALKDDDGIMVIRRTLRADNLLFPRVPAGAEQSAVIAPGP